MQSSHNLLHDWKAARIEKSYISQVGFLGSSIRTSFLRAWAVTAVKVLVIFTLMNLNIDVVSKMQDNVALLDSYMRDDYSIYLVDATPIATKKTEVSIPVIAVANLEPRGPSLNLASSSTVAGDSTIIPSEAINQ